jgi:hypothetical protein
MAADLNLSIVIQSKSAFLDGDKRGRCVHYKDAHEIKPSQARPPTMAI